MEALQFINTSPEIFRENLLNDLVSIINKPQEEEQLLTQQEVADFYRVSKATIIKWQKEGKINAYAIDNERRYKKSELLSALVKIKT